MISEYEVIQNLENLKSNECIFDYFIKIADENFRKDTPTVKEIIEKVLKICIEKEYSLHEARSYIILSWCALDADDVELSTEYALKANKIFEENLNEDGIFTSSNALMVAYMYMGAYMLTIEWGVKALKVAENLERKDRMFTILINLALCYNALEKYDQSKSMLDYVHDISPEFNIKDKITYFHAVSETEMHIGNISVAMEYITNAFKMSEKFKSDLLISDNYKIRAQIYEKLSLVHEAREDFEKAIIYSRKANSTNTYIDVIIKYSSFLLSIDEYEKALSQLIKTLDVAETYNSKVHLLKIYKLLSLAYKSKGLYEKSLFYLENSMEIEKEIINNEVNSYLLEVETEKIKQEARAYKNLYSEIAQLSHIGQNITSNLSLDAVFHTIYDELRSLMPIDLLGIARYDKVEKKIIYELFIYMGTVLEEEVYDINDSRSMGAYCIRNKEAILLKDLSMEYKDYISEIMTMNESKEVMKSIMFVPLLIENEAIGFLTVQCFPENQYTNNDLNKIKILASYVAIAIENAKLFKETNFYATHDYLTGVFNRKEILKLGETYLSQALASNSTLGVIMLDVDDFKKINDFHGHDMGDIIIKDICNIIENMLINKGHIGRYGGEEFLLIIYNSTNEKILEIAEEIRVSIENHRIVNYSDKVINITVSQGVQEICSDRVTLYEAITLADKALYKAKDLGKNRVEQIL